MLQDEEADAEDTDLLIYTRSHQRLFLTTYVRMHLYSEEEAAAQHV